MTKFALLALISLSSALPCAFGQVDLDALNTNHCEHVILRDGNRQLTNPPLNFASGNKTYFLQRKVTANSLRYELSYGETSVLLNDSTGTIKDFVVTKEHIWTIGNYGLRKYDMRGNKRAVYSFPKWAAGMRNLPRSIFYHQSTSTFYIASGRLGLLSFDLASESFGSTDALNTRNDDGEVSAAVALDGQNETLFIAMTGNSERGFNGVLVYDLTSKRIINRAEYHKRKVGVVHPYASIYAKGEMVYLNNGGWIHRLSADELATKSKILPAWLPIPVYQDGDRQFAMIDGDFIFADNQVIGCGNYLDYTEGELVSRALSYTLN